jgi:hypothetical protein
MGWTEQVLVRTQDQAVEHLGFGWGLFYTFSVLKRLVVAEMDWTEDFQCQREALLTRR